MKVGEQHFRSIWHDAGSNSVFIIDQRWLPHRFETIEIDTLDEFATAIREMWVRGAPLIGATAAWGMAKAVARDASDSAIDAAWETLHATRPTAINLRWALNRMRDHLFAHSVEERAGKPEGTAVNVLTHCNAGWLAAVDWGTATSPIYHAQNAGLNVHVWVDETRPRNQGALTAWELGSHGVPHTYIVDNAGGHLMQQGEIDLVIVGTDRTTRTGDVCNKIGTYLKALAARDNQIPFYVALPSPTIDWTVSDGVGEIPIEQRDDSEVRRQWGRCVDKKLIEVAVPPDDSPVGNPAFDVTPARLITGGLS